MFPIAHQLVSDLCSLNYLVMTQRLSLPPNGFEELPTYQSTSTFHLHPVLSPHGILAYRHRSTRLRIIHFRTLGPLISTTIFVGTEPISNAGHPHTLEHIIFLGSHQYPRAFLDDLACRSIANGTNAWTDNEFTAYTTTGAGFDGVSQLLPAYLDHILRPRINEGAFASEVYHITADGKEAGVVFCEMQARENTEDDLSDDCMRSTLFPGTPLAFNAGGHCDCIRGLTNKDIVKFHRDQYCTANVSVVIGGDFETERLLECVKPILDEVAAVPGFSPGQPAWQPMKNSPPDPFENEKHIRKIVRFPSPDEKIGSMIICWRGPGASEREMNLAIQMLFVFLCHNTWSPLRQEFVEKEDQVASDISFYHDDVYDRSMLSLTFSGVEHLGKYDEDDDEDDNDIDNEMDEGGSLENGASPKKGEFTPNGSPKRDFGVLFEETFLTSGKLYKLVMEYIHGIVDRNALPGGLGTMVTTIRKARDDELARLESGSHDVVTEYLKNELVYAHRNELVIGEGTRGMLSRFEALLEKDEAFWISLLREQVLNAPNFELVMVPDSKKSELLAEEERMSVEKRIEELGKAELERIGKENADRIDAIKVQKLDVNKFPPVPSTRNISRWPYSVGQISKTDFYSQSVTLQSNFARCNVLIDTSSMSVTERALLPMLTELVPVCDVLGSEGSSIPYQENTRMVSEATISCGTSGLSVGYSNGLVHQCVVLQFAATPSRLEEAVHLITQTFFNARITHERAAAISQSLIAETTAEMRDGDSVLHDLIPLIPFLEMKEGDFDIPNYVLDNLISMYPLELFVSEEFRRKNGKKNVQDKILAKLQNTLKALRSISGSNIFIQVMAKDPEKAREVIEQHWVEKQRSFLERTKGAMLNTSEYVKGRLPVGRRPVMKLVDVLEGQETARILGIGGVESSCMLVHVDSEVFKGHEDYSALAVLLEFLSRFEGPIFNAVRDSGLAYGVGMVNSSFYGRLTLSVYESSSPAAAWDAICNALIEFRKGLDSEDARTVMVDLETAKAARLYSLTSARGTPSRIQAGVLERTALGIEVGTDADSTLEDEVLDVSVKQLRNVFDRHVSKLLKPSNRLIALTCGQEAVGDIMKSFRSCKQRIDFEEMSLSDLQLPAVRELVRNFKE